MALRGRNGIRVEEIRLVDKTKSRNLDWASNTVVVKFFGTFGSGNESQRAYELCRAWWQRHSQIKDLGARAFFQVETREDGGHDVSLVVRGRDVQHETTLFHSVALRASDTRWEWFGIRLLDAAVRNLTGDPVDDELLAISLDALTYRA